MTTPEAHTAQRARSLLEARPIRHVVVLGANGTMGYGSGALFTTAVPRVTFLARTREKAAEGLAAAQRAVRSPTVADRVKVGSYEELEAAVADADLVFEAVTEDLALKRGFFERVDAARSEDALVATVTSGLSIEALVEGRSESFRRHFAGLHFFNPPSVIVGTELVGCRDTAPEVLDFLEAFGARRLGRAMVRVADRPGFAGNRIGFKVLNECAQLVPEHGVVLVERLVGPYTGRALTPLATIDLVGWDIHRAIVDNIHALAPDEAHASLALPPWMRALLEAGTLGNKSGKGFFRRDGKTKLALDPGTGDYRPVAEAKLPELGFIDTISALHRVGRYREALAAFASAPGEPARLARRVVAGYLAYALHRVGEVTETLAGIDDIMGFGFNWAPPGALVDLLGAPVARRLVEEAGLAMPRLLANANGGPTRLHHRSLAGVGKYFVAG
ncbi:MAG: 3-hydroxyacyl-CoA dehydrogenase family protein [Polyangiaceae bacterium]|nr:3-hydroxyacyl-CoA dehydrogenase family protein [Polyangiaceae bacterium]